MNNFLTTKSFHQYSLISKIFLFFIIISISFPHKAYSSELDNLFLKLKLSDNAVLARNYESKIWKIWLNSGSSDASNNQMQIGLKLMENGQLVHAQKVFEEISIKDPNWAESYNKIATIKFLKGDYSGSINDIQKTLKLEPRHFGAISGLVQINIILKNYEQALKNLEYVLKIHPNIGIKKLRPYLKKLLKKSSI
tara:strand:+ start:261 stop:845 length:585 start_codon:yes stop_codon:yes gene_type:complete